MRFANEASISLVASLYSWKAFILSNTSYSSGVAGGFVGGGVARVAACVAKEFGFP